jgi:hypothetical protein
MSGKLRCSATDIFSARGTALTRTSVPTNLAGVVYVPFPKGGIDAGFHVLHRELKAIYNL